MYGSQIKLLYQVVGHGVVDKQSKNVYVFAHARIQKILSEGVQPCQRFSFFLVGGRRKDPHTTINGPLSAQHRNAI